MNFANNFTTEDGIKQTLERLVEVYTDEILADGFQPMVSFYTESVPGPRVTFFPRITGEKSYDDVLWGCSALASALSDLVGITLVFDGYQTTRKTRLNGEPWGPRGMEFAVRNQTEDAQFVFEALTCQAINANGQHFMASIQYERKDGELVLDWDKVSVFSSGEAQGRFPEILEMAISVPKLNHLGGALFEDDPMKASALTLSTVVKAVINNTRMTCILSVLPGEQEHIKDSMENGPFSENVRVLDQDEVQEIVALDEAFEAPAYERE